MAISTKSNRSRAPSRPCPEGCGFTIAAKDLHVECPACLGPEHAQAALQAPISCNQCSKLMSDDGEEEDDKDPFAPRTESPGYQPGVEVQQMAAGGTTLHKVCR